MKKANPSYLDTLKFDPKLLSSFPAKYLANVRIPILLILAIIFLGVYSFVSIPRRLNPEVKIPLVIVSTVLPGAGPSDVEQLLTVPIERELGGVSGLDTMSSVSRESVSIITLMFRSEVDPKTAESDVQSLVNRVATLPEEAQDPRVQSIDFEDQPVWTFAVTSKSDSASLMRFAESLKKEIENIDQIDRVSTSGLDDQTIDVVVDLVRAREYNLSPITISRLIQTAAKSYPAGIVNSSNSSFSLSINEEIITVDDIRNLRVNVGETSVRLGDIAQISSRSKPGQTNTYIASPVKKAERAVQFFVFKKSTVNIDEAFKVTEPVVNEEIAKYGGAFSLYSVMNTAELIDEQFGSLYGEFFNTSILVFLLLLIFLGLRQGIISNVTVPLTFLGTFAVMQALGLTLNFLTVFSLLLTLGILIDDTIVVVAAMTRYYKTGRFSPYETGIMVWRDFIVPLWSSAITTIWGFVPLLIASGIIGVFIKSIPIVVTTTMLISTLISVFITIPLMIVFLKPQFPHRVRVLLAVLGVLTFSAIFILLSAKNLILPFILIASLFLLYVLVRSRGSFYGKYKEYIENNRKANHFVQRIKHIFDHGLINIEYLSEAYRRVIEKVLSNAGSRKRTIIAIAAFTILAYLLVPLGLVKNEFCRKEDAEILYVAVDMPSGLTNQYVTEETIYLADRLRETPETTYMVAEVGQVIQPTGQRDSEPDAILFTLHLTKNENRSITSSEIAQNIRNRFSDYTRGKISVIEQSGGPPVGAEIQIQLLGEDLGILNDRAERIVEFLSKEPGVINVEKSIKPGTSKVVFVPDKTKLVEAGLTVDTISLWLRIYASGFSLDKVLFGEDEEEIVFRVNSYDNKPLETITAIEIPLMGPTGGSVPLSSLGNFKLEYNPTTITREDQKRSISVFGGVTAGVNVPEKNAKLLSYANTLSLPSGYEWKTGGVNEENEKSVNSILTAMGLSFMLILITMVIEFGSFRQAFIAMLMIPISVAGVLYIFALVGVPLSFTALIGVLALFGIVMRHAIVVLEKINENRAHGLSLHQSIADAASSRLEPVLLTSLATIAGLIPITIADPLWRGLGGAIIAGLLFTGALKLFIIPVLYYNFYKGEEK